MQALFYSDLFRDNVIKYPPHSPSETPNGARPKVSVTIRPPMNPTPPTLQPKHKSPPASQAMKQRQAVNPGQPLSGQAGIKPEDKPDTPEYKKKQAMIKGPILELARENAVAYGMDECTFTGLKDIFLALMDSKTRTGVLSPQRFLEIFKRDNEMFRNSMHQDAHEFYGLVLNDVIANVEARSRKAHEHEAAQAPNGLVQSVENALSSGVTNNANGHGSPGTGWVHDIFEGVLTSETKCLTCETASQRDETFLDLSIDLEEHSSVTSCLRKFSAEEMLCERNKFHCDHCGGLQEAEKRMKVKRLPKVLTLHLKRFKYTDDYSRLQKLFHRVVYPYHLRMFNTTEEAEDPDRLYELYAVVVHIGGNVYHGHYVSIIKTKDRGWVLFDDEMVEPVDKHFVRNFFGDKPGMATAYVLFYQETTFDKVREEQEREGMEEVKLAAQAAHVAHEGGDKTDSAPLKRQTTQPTPLTLERESMAKLSHARTAPDLPSPPPVGDVPAMPTPLHASPQNGPTAAKQNGKTKEEKKREKKEREAAEKAAKQAEKEKGKQAKEAEKEKEKQAKEAEKEKEKQAKEAEREKEKQAKEVEKEKEKLAKEAERERGRQAKEAERERERQAKEEEKRRREEKVGGPQARKSEQDEAHKPHDEGTRSEAREEEARKKEPNGSGSIGGSMAGILDRSRKGSKSMSKRSFSFFHKDKGVGDASPGGNENGEAPEKQEKTKGRLSIGLGRKKSGNLLS